MDCLRSRSRPSHELMCESGVAIAEIRELSSVLRHLAKSDVWRPRIAELMGGHVSPYKDKRVLHRSLHFELYLASRAMAAGLKPQRQEPDLLINHNGWRLGIAAKRLNSRSKIADRLADGARQIAGTKHQGIIAVDLSKVVFGKDHVIMINEYTQLYYIVESIYKEQLKPIIDNAIRKLPYFDRVLGLLVYTNTVGFDKMSNCPVDNMVRFCILPSNMPQKQKHRVAAVIRCFYREDGSLSSECSDKELDKFYSQTIRNPFS